MSQSTVVCQMRNLILSAVLVKKTPMQDVKCCSIFQSLQIRLKFAVAQRHELLSMHVASKLMW